MFQGLPYQPRTLVSYSISGGIGYRAPAVLLQAVVYARGGGPACVMKSAGAEDDKADDGTDLGGKKGGDSADSKGRNSDDDSGSGEEKGDEDAESDDDNEG